ncbi:MAG: transglycosylase SLT domain-containing protein [bacterium]|nr:transglycosylase SLT domain-containing protein [bacterium]MBU1918139.1 transglycosylase SLT domain-containing protein [bacterium]
MKRKLTYLLFVFFLLASCDALVMGQVSQIEDDITPSITGAPSNYSQAIYASTNLNDLCLADECEAEYDILPDDYREFYDDLLPNVCAFDVDPNENSQFVVHQTDDLINGTNLILSKKDLFFLAWTSMRYRINPHYLLGVLMQESSGNCAAVSGAGAEGCFQITNDYGKEQLEESYEERVNNWYWNENSSDYYADSLFVGPEEWFGEEPDSDQFRMTLEPGSEIVGGVAVSSVVNFNFGVMAAGMYYRWQEYFLYNNYASLRSRTTSYITSTPETKASLMAAAYNGGIGRLSNALQWYSSNYLSGMRYETRSYVKSVLSHCRDFQSGSAVYATTYSFQDIEEIIDLITVTYDATLEVDSEALKKDIHQNFFADQEELTLVDDIKALIYFISTYDSSLAPEWPVL